MTTLIKQKGFYDCALASISMAAGHSTWEQLWNEEDLKAVEGKGVSDETPWLLRAGFEKYRDYRRVFMHGEYQQVVKNLLWRRRAMIAANSLNTPDGGHMMYWNGEELFDPSTQRTFLHLNSMLINSVIIFNDQKET